jgi:hypothetical protein
LSEKKNLGILKNLYTDPRCFDVLSLIYIYINLKFVFVYFVKSVIALKELRETLQSPLYNVKQLKVEFRNPYNINIELVDALLWISPLLEILWIELLWKDANICFKVRIAYVHL